MALYTELPVYRPCYLLLQSLSEYTKSFPRQYRYNLGKTLIDKSTDLVTQLFTINSSYDKLPHLNKFQEDFQTLLTLIRLVKDLKCITVRQFSTITPMMDAIGKQITGWKKYVSGNLKKDSDISTN